MIARRNGGLWSLGKMFTSRCNEVGWGLHIETTEKTINNAHVWEEHVCQLQICSLISDKTKSRDIGLLGSVCEESHHIYQPKQDRSDFLVLLDFKQLNKSIIKFEDEPNLSYQWRWFNAKNIKNLMCHKLHQNQRGSHPCLLNTWHSGLFTALCQKPLS